MKIVIAFLAALIAVVISENCQSNLECQQHHQTLCDGATNGRVVCRKVCTCVVRTNGTHHGSCTTQQDCLDDAHQCPNQANEHCVDNVCHCEHRPGTGGHQLAVVISENCQSNLECQQHHQTLCDGATNGRVVCRKVCTCVVRTNGTHHGSCTTQQDCLDDAHQCPNQANEHCVDNVCHCEHRPGTGGHQLG